MPLLALTLLVAIVGAVVLATVAGSRRTRSTIERLDSETRSISAGMVLEGESLTPADEILALPQVEIGDRAFTVWAIPPEGYLPLIASVDGALGQELQRDQILRGRRADQSEPLEVALSEPDAARFGLDVGDVLPLFLPDHRYAPCVFGQGEKDEKACADFFAVTGSGEADVSTLDGTPVELAVVGVTRGIADVSARPDDIGLVTLTRAFYESYREYALQPVALVRLRDGVTVEEFEDALGAALPEGTVSDFFETSGGLDALDAMVGVLANGLLAFGGVAALAGLVAVTQALARQAAAGSAERAALRSIGATRRALAVDALGPLVPVAFAGAVLAVLGAWLASQLMPIGTARRAETHRGLQVDSAVLIIGGLVVALVVLATAAAAAWWVAHSSSVTHRRGRTPRALARSVPATVGVRFAFDPGRASRAVPVRSAISGVALGVAGVVAVSAFGAALTRLGDEPARYGYGWDLSISGSLADDPEPMDDPTLADVPEGERDAVAAERRAQRIAADRDVVGVVRMWWGYRARVAGRSVTAYAQHAYSGESAFVIVAGREPRKPGEVALGGKTLQSSGVGIGDMVDVAGRPLRVVGQAIFPITDDGFSLADGVLLDDTEIADLGLLELGRRSGFSTMAVLLRDGADRDAASTRLQVLNRDEAVTFDRVPPEVDQLRQLDDLPALLAVFLFVVAVLAVGHALVLTVRRRVGDLAVLRVLGCTPAQTRRTVAWQASTLAFVGAMLGVPLGLLLGRYIWAAVAYGNGVSDDPAWPVFAVVLALPVTILLANAVAWWPGRRAARARPAVVLRAE